MFFPQKIEQNKKFLFQKMSNDKARFDITDVTDFSSWFSYCCKLLYFILHIDSSNVTNYNNFMFEFSYYTTITGE